MSWILGINDGVNATAALMQDGRIVACISEERLTRRKNQIGYPKNSVQWCLNYAGISQHDLDAVVLGGQIGPQPGNYDQAVPFIAHPRSSSLASRLYQNLYSASADAEYRLPRLAPHQRLTGLARHLGSSQNLEARIACVTTHLQISAKIVMAAPHHHAHAYAALAVGAQENSVVLTCDGEGDFMAAGVWRIEEGRLRLLEATDQHSSLGHVYSAATAYLRMNPHEHEYKVMGLAPYADQAQSIEHSQRFLDLLHLDSSSLIFESPVSTRLALRWIQEKMSDLRFDVLAGALQHYTEEILVQWARASLKKYGSGSLALSGGVFMNVKANGRLSQLDLVQKLFLVPSCGDESLAIGALAWYRGEIENKTISPIKDLYLGPEYSEEEIVAALGEDLLWHAPTNLDVTIAEMLAQGEVVARFTGRMEWGARALGNRSLLADPRNIESVEILNRQIKSRDFWMPFAISILERESPNYIQNPKNIPAPYMMLALPTTPEGRMSLIAGIHRADGSCRPQIVEGRTPWGQFIKIFGTLTGVGAVLNTSFNLHGEPIVCSPTDAVSTLRRSGLRHLNMGPYLISKRSEALNKAA